MSEEESENRIKIPELEEIIEDFYKISSGLEFETEKKEKYVSKLLQKHTGSPFAIKNKFSTPNREILYWAMALGLVDDNAIKIRNGSNTVPNDVFERSQYTFWLARVSAIINEDDPEAILKPTVVRRCAQDYANGGIKSFYDNTLGLMRGTSDFEAGLIALISKHIEEAKKVLEKYNPPDFREETNDNEKEDETLDVDDEESI